MNARTAKLLRKYSVAVGGYSEYRKLYRPLKRAWNRVPRNQRHVQREQVKSNL